MEVCWRNIACLLGDRCRKSIVSMRLCPFSSMRRSWNTVTTATIMTTTSTIRSHFGSHTMFRGNCPLCLEAILPVDAWSWPCGHAAHKDCATKASRAKPCPICRAPPDPRGVHALPSFGEFPATPTSWGGPPPAPPVIILCCPRVTHDGA